MDLCLSCRSVMGLPNKDDELTTSMTPLNVLRRSIIPSFLPRAIPIVKQCLCNGLFRSHFHQTPKTTDYEEYNILTCAKCVISSKPCFARAVVRAFCVHALCFAMAVGCFSLAFVDI